jgi:hypothetical protein
MPDAYAANTFPPATNADPANLHNRAASFTNLQDAALVATVEDLPL